MAQCLPFAGTAKAIFLGWEVTMSEPAVLRLKRFEMAQKAQKVSLLETMVRDFENLALDLAQQIADEEERTKN